MPPFWGRYAGNARNYGFSISNGSYVTFVDSDDILDKTAITSIISSLKSKSFDISYSFLQSFPLLVTVLFLLLIYVL